MSQFFPLVILGFAMILLSLSFSSVGVAIDKFWLSMIGAVLFIPCAYLFGVVLYPSWLGFFLLLFQFGSAAAVRQKNVRWAWYLLMPSFLATLKVLIDAFAFFA